MATELLPGSFCDAGGLAGLVAAGGVLRRPRSPARLRAKRLPRIGSLPAAGEGVAVAGEGEAGAVVAAGEIGVRGPRGFVPAGIAATVPHGGRTGFAVAALPVAAGRTTCAWHSAGLPAISLHAEANLHGSRRHFADTK